MTPVILRQYWISFVIGGLVGIGVPVSEASETHSAPWTKVAHHYADLVHAVYEDAWTAAGHLENALQQLVADPTPAHLSEARLAWIRSRQPFLQTEAFRFYAGPIDDANGPEPLINGWPLEESYIDYVKGAPEAGLIQDQENYPTITPDLLQRLNERAGETAITCGYHAIEFLLWGQDFFPDSPGKRPATDYSDARNAKRRGAYLLACSTLLRGHLKNLVESWAPGRDDNYRSRFLAQDPRLSLWYALYGVNTFCGKELAGERLLVAWDTSAQEDEHSCFSDTTLQDLRFDLLGADNVYRGRYRRLDGTLLQGPGFRLLLQSVAPTLVAGIEHQLDRAKQTIRAIPHPFDQAILRRNPEGRRRIMASVEALEALASLLAQAEQQLIKHQVPVPSP